MDDMIDRAKEAKSFEELRDIVVEFMEKVNNHTHKLRVPNEDPYNPFTNYTETEGME